MEMIEIVTTKQVKIGELRAEYTTPIRCPEDAAHLLFTYLEGADREHFVVLCLDTKNQVNKIETVSIGSLNSAIVTPREVFKTAILANSASIIVAHNHPSGNPEPSREDIEVTKRLQKAGEVIGIEVLDHVVIADGEKFVSLKEKGLI